MSGPVIVIDPMLLAIIAATFLLAGFIKGVAGLGLPSVSLGLLTVAIDLPSAMVLLLAPSFLTNLWQASVGGNAQQILRRLWPFMLVATVTVWIGALALPRINLAVLSTLLGLLLTGYAVAQLLGFRLEIAERKEAGAGILCGALNGVLGGMTGSFVLPGVPYLQALGLPREVLIQAMGILFTLSTVALALALQRHELWTAELGIASVVGVVPAIAGMVIGTRIRKLLSEHLFRRLFFLSLAVLGSYIVVSSVAGI